MKKLYAIVLLIAIQVNSYAASTAKVRVAARAIAQVGQTVLNAAKANKLRSAALAYTIGLAGYTTYRYNKHERAIAQAVKQQKKLAAEHAARNNIFEDALGWKDGALLVGEYINHPAEDQAAANFVEQKKIVAACAREYTFKRFVHNVMHNPAPLETPKRIGKRILRTTLAVGLMGTFAYESSRLYPMASLLLLNRIFEPNHYLAITGVNCALGALMGMKRKKFTTVANMLRDMELPNTLLFVAVNELFWSQNQLARRWHASPVGIGGSRRGLYTSEVLGWTSPLYTWGRILAFKYPYLSLLPASIDAALFAKAWLDERDSRAKFAEWQARPAQPRDPAWRQPVAGEDAAAREARYARWLAARSPA